MLTVPVHGHYLSHLQQQTLFQAGDSNITAGTVPNFGSAISTVAGSGDGFQGQVLSHGHGITGLSEGGAGSTVTGQFVTVLTIR